MGTNYYSEKPPCPTCGSSARRIHIGKSSYGWKFAIAANNWEYYDDPASFFAWLEKQTTIYDEYGRLLSPGEMALKITEKQIIDNPEDEESNHHIYIDGYVFIQGDFS